MKKQKTHALIIVLIITMIQLGNYAFAQNVFPTGAGTFVGIGTTTPVVNLEVRGDVKFIDPGSMEEISFGRPGGENGFNLTHTSGSSAHFKFDGITLRLVMDPIPGGGPLNTAGIAIDKTFGWVGLGTTAPQCRFQLNDGTTTNYGSFFNTNSNGPTLFVDRNPNGGLNPSSFLAGGYGSVFLNSLYTASPGAEMISGYFNNIDPGRNVSTGIKSEATAVVQSGSSIGVNSFANKAITSIGTLSVASGDITSYGVFGEGNNGVTSDYGVFGRGIGNGCSDVFGVYGEARAGKNNYGIYGTAGPAAGPIPDCNPTSIWAGYFAGDVFATGNFIPSDKQFKENTTTFNNALNIISKLNPQTYTFKKSNDFLGLSLPEGLKYGFIAQELENVLPTLVKKSHNPEIKDRDGKLISKSFDFKSVDYTALIPILVEGIKEQQTQIEELKNQLKNNSNGSKPNNNGTANDLSEAVLYQNAPNPFSENTTIKYHLANIGDAASIMVFDMNGKLLKTYELNTQNVDGDVQISSGTLIAGMYYYSLVVKGKEISTLKMILAK